MLATAISDDRRLLDEVIYLAVLVPELSKVDTILDSVRMVTATAVPGQALSPEKRAELQKAKLGLEQYLTRQDQITAFTPESLQVRVKEHFERGSKAWLRLTAVLATVLCATIGSAFVPTSSPDMQSIVVVSTFNSTLSLGAAFFFLTSLKAFSGSVRKAFINIGIGFACISLSQIVLPILIINFPQGTLGYEAIGTWIATVDLISIFFLYVGVRMYARQTNIQSQLFMPGYIITILAITIGVSSIAMLLLRQGSGIEKVDIVLQSCMVVMYIVLGLLTRRVARSLTVLYSKAAHALLHALTLINIVTAYFLVYYVLLLFYSEKSLEFIFFPGVIVGSITCILNLRAGYIFYKSSRY